LWRWIDGETELGFLTVINGKSFEEEGSESRSSSTTDGIEDKETLKTSTLISKFSNSIKAEIDDFLTNGVMSSSEVVSSIFFS
jgi:hypothetical protein